MKAPAFLRPCARLNFPVALLVALLQRTPLLRLATGAEAVLVDSPVGAVLRGVVTAVASLGAIQSMAGATPLVAAPASASSGLSTSVGAAVQVFYTVTGTQTPPASWQVTGDIPPGLSFSGLKGSGGIVNVETLALTGTPTTAGTYSVTITTYEGPNATLIPSPDYAYTITVTGGSGGGGGGSATAPTFTAQPQSQTVNAGATVTFSATASGSPAPAFQWRKDGANLAGASGTTLTLSNVAASDAGTYSVVATNSAGTVTSNVATLTVNTPVTGGGTSGSGTGPSRIINMSVLTSIGTGETMTFGYFLGGSGTTGTKSMLMRAMGPTLGAAPFSLSGTLPDPFMEFYNGSTKVAENNDWSGDPALSAAVTAVQAFPFVSASSKDAAIFATGVGTATGHSIKISGVGGGSGLVLAELYDETPGAQFTPTTPRLINVSLLKNVGTSTTLGFFIDGGSSVKVLIRAVGPTLAGAPFNLGGVIADPKMALYAQGNSQTPIATNDNWGGTAALTAAFQATNAFALDPNSKDAAIVQTLAPGGYSVQVSPASGTTGLAIIEVYEVP